MQYPEYEKYRKAIEKNQGIILNDYQWEALVQICAQIADESCTDYQLKPDTESYYAAYTDYMNMALYESSLNLPNLK